MELNKRKGFTIVELVIVIAVIAILAAVLIPNISNLVKKANASADESLVRNLNTALSMDVEKHQTMDAALEAALNNGGYELTTIVTKNKDNKILWDSKNDCFVYMKKGASKPTYLPNTQEVKDVNEWDYFEILDKLPEGGTIANTQKYSVYLAGDAYTGNVVTPVGFDAGKNAVSKITFATEGSVSALINTNGGELVVNATNANVEHRGEATIVTIEAVATASYHENGKVNEIKLEKGRVVVEAKAEVGSVLITATEIKDNNVSVEVKDTGSLGAVGATDGEIAKKLNTVVKSSDKTDIINTAVNNSDFAGGFGTEKAPYLIANLEQWMNLAAKSNSKKDALSCKGKYFSVLCDLDFATVTSQVQLKYFVGYIDFNNHTVQNLQVDKKQSPTMPSSAYASLFGSIEGESKISNLNFVVYSPKVDNSTKLVSYINYSRSEDLFNVTLDNITVDGVVRYADNNTGLFVYWAGKCNLYFKNCTNKASIYNNGYTGAFLGRTYVAIAAYKQTLYSYCESVSFENCQNYGTIISIGAAGKAFAAMLISNCSEIERTDVSVKNCTNYGVILAEGVNLVVSTKEIEGCNVENKGQLGTGSFKSISVVDGKYNMTATENAVRYEMAFIFPGAGSGGGIVSKSFELTATELNNVNAYEWIDIKDVNGDTVTSISGYGTTYKICGEKYVFEDEYGSYIKKQPEVTVTAFDKDGVVIATYILEK